jgi:hypothetical protein
MLLIPGKFFPSIRLKYSAPVEKPGQKFKSQQDKVFFVVDIFDFSSGE